MLRVLDDSHGERASRPAPAYLATARPVRFAAGFHGEEGDLDGPFRWMEERGRLEFAPEPVERFLELTVYSDFFDLSQHLDATAGRQGTGSEDGRTEDASGVRIELPHGWSRASLAVPADATHVDLAANRLFPPAYYPDDPRRLAVRLRPPRLHADAERHRHLAAQHANRVLNWREMVEGRTELTSTPPSLGIDMHGVCNVKPPCVYCEWDSSKAAEGDNVDRPFGRDTVEEWGALFDNAGHLVNCSIGEPFMMKNVDQLFDLFGDRAKSLEMTTNGQILTQRNVSRLLGRRVDLYVSLDAATPETYAKLRNDKFERILVNLRHLIAAKGGRGGLPRVYLVFMPMRVNVHELEGVVRLCADLGVDRMILRPLNDSPDLDLDWERGGHHFAYQEQLLPLAELVEVSGRARALCERHGVPLSDQMDFGEKMSELFAERFAAAYRSVLAADGDAGDAAGAGGTTGADAAPEDPARDAAAPSPPVAAAPEPAAPKPPLGSEALPPCHEPWKSLYILRRGIYPCCYGGEPIAAMDDHASAWNSPQIQEIRRELAAGRLAPYCHASPACPIVRKAAGESPDRPQRRPPAGLRRAWHRLNDALGGVPGRLLRPVKPLVARLTGLL